MLRFCVIYLGIVGIECGLFLQKKKIRHVGFIYIVQSELSSKFLCEEDKFLSIKKKQNRFCSSNRKSWGVFNCPYKSAILWRHIFV